MTGSDGTNPPRPSAIGPSSRVRRSSRSSDGIASRAPPPSRPRRAGSSGGGGLRQGPLPPAPPADGASSLGRKDRVPVRQDELGGAELAGRRVERSSRHGPSCAGDDIRERRRSESADDVLVVRGPRDHLDPWRTWRPRHGRRWRAGPTSQDSPHFVQVAPKRRPFLDVVHRDDTVEAVGLPREVPRRCRAAARLARDEWPLRSAGRLAPPSRPRGLCRPRSPVEARWSVCGCPRPDRGRSRGPTRRLTRRAR
jgi:hypothetical protein